MQQREKSHVPTLEIFLAGHGDSYELFAVETPARHLRQLRTGGSAEQGTGHLP